MKKILTTLVLAFSAMTMMAEEFKIGKLTFEITSSTEVSLTKADQDITKVFLGETIDYQGKTYTLTEIRRRAFDDCSSLSSITIPCSVEDIETMAFFNCKSLTSVTILSCRFGIDIRIQYMAFWGCSSLKSVTIPDNIKRYFYWDAFKGSALYDDPSNWENGALYIDNCLIEVDTSFVGNFKIKENTYLIANEAFKDCQSLISVTIPNGVKVIGDGAFLGCKSLTSVTIPNSVTEIGSNAFEGCSSLTSITVDAGNTHYDSRNNSNAIIETATNTLIAGCKTTTIPNSVTSIGDYAFSGCTSLTSITIPNSVTWIGSEAFVGCSSLQSITVDAGNTHYDSRNNCNAIIETETNTLIAGCKNTTIPNSVTEIEAGAFEGCSSLKSVTIPYSVTSIGYWAFDGCTSLTSITIPNSVTEIEWGAFRNCTNLKTIYIPRGSKARFAKMDGLEDLQHLLIER